MHLRFLLFQKSHSTFGSCSLAISLWEQYCHIYICTTSNTSFECILLQWKEKSSWPLVHARRSRSKYHNWNRAEPYTTVLWQLCIYLLTDSRKSWKQFKPILKQLQNHQTHHTDESHILIPTMPNHSRRQPHCCIMQFKRKVLNQSLHDSAKVSLLLGWWCPSQKAGIASKMSLFHGFFCGNDKNWLGTCIKWNSCILTHLIPQVVSVACLPYFCYPKIHSISADLGGVGLKYVLHYLTWH